MYKLLAVDDEYESRNTLCNCFPWNQVGFEVVAQVDNGQSALDFILSHEVDIILCDIKMPVMSGIELAKEVHNRKLKPIIVFLSGYRNFEYAQKALAFGVRYYVIKPARYEELMDMFSELKNELDNRMASDELNSVKTSDNRNKEELNSQDRIIINIKKYIDENYRTATLENAANEVHLNACYLSQIFKQKSGCNFSDYLIEVKMKKAAELLKDIYLKTYDVSELVGYTNAKNFSRTFKNYFGVSPREYRNGQMTLNELG